jgi:subtilase family serine protease
MLGIFRAPRAIRRAGITLIVGLAAGAAALIPASAAGAAPAAAAARVEPFSIGHVLKAGTAAQPPTTAQCEKKYKLACYQTFQLERAYNLNALYDKGIEGQGATIAVVDPFGSPSMAADLKTFDRDEHLPNPPSFKVITPAGKITTTAKTCTKTYKPTGPDECSDYYGWTDETSLDVEWAHAMAPKANILLVETPVTETEGIYGFPQIVAAENYVINHHLADVITQSFGANESTFTSPGQIYSLRSAYLSAAKQGVTVLAASGDDGSTDATCSGTKCANPDNPVCCQKTPATGWPDSDPLVTAVGGTQLHLTTKGVRTSADTVWDDLSSTLGVTGPVYTEGASGGGLSKVFSRPAFQDGVARTVGDSRGVPDISMSAAINGGVDIYDTTDPSTAGWSFVGGTSEATPLFSGIVALADQVAGHKLGDLNPELYALAQGGGSNGIVPVTKGTNTFVFCPVADTKSDGSCKSASDLVTVPGFTANGYYSNATGLGTVNAAAFVPALAHHSGW